MYCGGNPINAIDVDGRSTWVVRAGKGKYKVVGGNLNDNDSKKNNYEFTYLNCSRDDIEGAVKENTKAIYIETPTNPMMNVSDICAIAKIAKKHNILLIVDNTFLSPYFQNPLKLGNRYRT